MVRVGAAERRHAEIVPRRLARAAPRGRRRGRGRRRRRRGLYRIPTRVRADFPPGLSVTAIRGPREGGTAQQHVAGPGRRAAVRHAAVRHVVHNQLVIAVLGVEGGRAQAQINSQARRRDRAILVDAVVGGVVGRASTGTVYSARPDDGEEDRGRRRHWGRRRGYIANGGLKLREIARELANLCRRICLGPVGGDLLQRSQAHVFSEAPRKHGDAAFLDDVGRGNGPVRSPEVI